MSKKSSKTVFVCSDCGSEYAKWQGQCADCNAWNTLTSLSIEAAPGVRSGYAGKLELPKKLIDVSVEEQSRLATGVGELDLVLRGGLVPGSAVLISGHPAAGQTTLVIQVMCR